METISQSAPRLTNRQKLMNKAWNQRALFFMLLTCVVLVGIFYYAPMYGWLMAAIITVSVRNVQRNCLLIIM